VISDIHGNLGALNQVIEDFKSQGATQVIVLGDIVFFGDEPEECFRIIQALKPIAWIKGNTDDWINIIDDNFKPSNYEEEHMYKEFLRVKDKMSSTSFDFISDLPLTTNLEISNTSILCVHGSDLDYLEQIGLMTEPAILQEIFKRMKKQIMLCGHSHQQFFASDSGKSILNVGSVGRSFNELYAEYMLLQIEDTSYSYIFRSVLKEQ
jgi:putative phosphoesterase